MAGWRNSELETLSSSAGAILTGDSYYRDVARGKVNGATQFGSYGKRVTVGAESGIIWPDGAYNIPPAAGLQMTLYSTSDEDGPSAGGTGILTVHIHYLDSNLESQTITVTMNGIAGQATVQTDIRFIQCMHMGTFGTAKKAVGTITAENGGVVYSQIDAGAKRCSSSVRMVPSGKRLLVLGAVAGIISGTAAAQGTVKFAATHFDGHDYTDDSVFIPSNELGFQDNSFGIKFPIPEVFTEGAAVGMEFDVDKAATVTGTWFGIIEDAV